MVVERGDNGVNLSFVSFFSECAPSATFHVVLCNDEIGFVMRGLVGFMCRKYRHGPLRRCYNCSFCSVGTYYPTVDSHTNCLKCPAGNYLSLLIIICYCFFFHYRFSRKARRLVPCIQMLLVKKSRISLFKILLELRRTKIHSFFLRSFIPSANQRIRLANRACAHFFLFCLFIDLKIKVTRIN